MRTRQYRPRIVAAIALTAVGSIAILSASQTKVPIKSVAAPKKPAAPDQLVHVDLAYGGPGSGPTPNFSPKGTQVPLTPVPASMMLPAGAIRPAKTGAMKIGPNEKSWMPVLVTADAAHPKDLCHLFLDRNRDGDFTNDGPALDATVTQREKTNDWWSSFARTELTVPYETSTQPYLTSFWIVRPADSDVPPDIMRFSVGSWRAGKARINGIETLVAAMDGNNDALFDKTDMWSALPASAIDAPKAVLSIAEARVTSRLMFTSDATRELVLEFRAFSPDGTGVDFAVVDRPTSKKADRAPDDTLAVERPRERAGVPFTWEHTLDAALAKAKASGKKVFIDFETTWCGPCKTMDEWIWTDAEVAGLLTKGYIGVKLDGDIEKAIVKRLTVAGYPTMVVMDATGKELKRLVGYQSSAEMIAALR